MMLLISALWLTDKRVAAACNAIPKLSGAGSAGR